MPHTAATAATPSALAAAPHQLPERASVYSSIAAHAATADPYKYTAGRAHASDEWRALRMNARVPSAPNPRAAPTNASSATSSTHHGEAAIVWPVANTVPPMIHSASKSPQCRCHGLAAHSNASAPHPTARYSAAPAPSSASYTTSVSTASRRARPRGAPCVGGAGGGASASRGGDGGASTSRGFAWGAGGGGAYVGDGGRAPLVVVVSSIY